MKFDAEGREFGNSEKSVQFLKQNAFLNSFLDVSQI